MFADWYYVSAAISFSNDLFVTQKSIYLDLDTGVVSKIARSERFSNYLNYTVVRGERPSTNKINC